VDAKFSALERAFQMARSGRVANIEDIKKSLTREGYNVGSAYDGRSLRSQLRHLIKAARLERGKLPSGNKAIAAGGPET
jgi:hypothetical protein